MRDEIWVLDAARRRLYVDGDGAGTYTPLTPRHQRTV
jgi:hypothetical protein